MRTNIEIDDQLLSQAMSAAGKSTKRATVEEGLRLLVRLRKQTEALAELKGLGWDGDLDEMRLDRPSRGPAAEGRGPSKQGRAIGRDSRR